VSGQLYAPFTLLPVDSSPVHTEWDAGWAPLLLWMLWKGEKISCHCWESNHDSHSLITKQCQVNLIGAQYNPYFAWVEINLY